MIRSPTQIQFLRGRRAKLHKNAQKLERRRTKLRKNAKKLGRRRTTQNGPPAATWAFSMYASSMKNKIFKVKFAEKQISFILGLFTRSENLNENAAENPTSTCQKSQQTSSRPRAKSVLPPIQFRDNPKKKKQVCSPYPHILL